MHESYMLQALALAEEAQAAGEVPVGAVVVLGREIVGQGRNSPITLSDPTAHAEMLSIREACASPSRTPRGKCGSDPWSPPTSSAETCSTRVVRRHSKNSLLPLSVVRSYGFFHLHCENFIFQPSPRWGKRSHAGRQSDMPPQ